MSTICRRSWMVSLLILIVAVTASWSQSMAQPKTKVAAIVPGTVLDGEYNTLALLSLKSLEQTGACEIAYSEKVAVPDAERVMREYVAGGYKIMWAHGAQFNNAVISIADAHPEVSFIIEIDSKPAATGVKRNIWYIDRNTHTGFYAIGKLATLVTRSNKVAYIGGLPLPFGWGNIHAVKQAIADSGKGATLSYVHCGDFNDPVKGKQAAEALIAKGHDVLFGDLSLGNTGVFQAIREAKTPVFVAVNMTSRKDQLPDRYLTSDMVDLIVPINYIFKQVTAGTKGGYYFMEYGHPGKPRFMEVPISNVNEKVQKEVKQTIDNIISGKIKVALDQSKE